MSNFQTYFELKAQNLLSHVYWRFVKNWQVLSCKQMTEWEICENKQGVSSRIVCPLNFRENKQALDVAFTRKGLMPIVFYSIASNIV